MPKKNEQLNHHALPHAEDGKLAGKDPGAAASRKDAIMHSALKLFLEQGYFNTTLRQIAQDSNSSASLIVYHFGSKQAIASEFLQMKLHELQQELVKIIDMRTEPELFCCTFVRLYQTVMSAPAFCKFYHDMIEEGLFQKFFFSEGSAIKPSDLILVKHQVHLSSELYTFYSRYILPGIEMAAWISAGEDAPSDEKLDMPFRTLMGIIYVDKEDVDRYCAQAKELVNRILQEHPEYLSY